MKARTMIAALAVVVFGLVMQSALALQASKVPEVSFTNATSVFIGPAQCSESACIDTCVGYGDCVTCLNYCRLVTPTPGGDGVAVFLVFLPIIVLLFLTLKPNPWDSVQSLPTAAAILLLVRLMYLRSDPINVMASVVSGFFEVATPISIIAGAIFLFDVMSHTGCMPWIMRELKLMSGGHPVAEVMLIGWAFAYMIEGASGFGTPVALASPMLIQLGHDPIAAVSCCLLTNTLATVFGAVGTPVWFGFAALNLPEDELLQVGLRATIGVAFACLIVPMLAVSILVPFRVIFRNVIFFYLSVAACIVPALGVAFFSYEFGSIIGGMVGCVLTAVLIRFRVGLKYDNLGASESTEDATSASGDNLQMSAVDLDGKSESGKSVNELGDAHSIGQEEEKPAWELSERETGGKYFLALFLRTFPLTATVLLLVLTRIEPIGLKGLLKAKSPTLFVLDLGTFGRLEWYASFVISIYNFLTDPAISWNYETFYTPCILPFFTVGLITCFIHIKDMDISFLQLFLGLAKRLAGPYKSLIGAMILVGLFRNGGDGSPAYILGATVSGWVGAWWILLSPFLGVLGSFFSGSTTISNLTFGQVQSVAAASIGVSQSSILALQACGATAGNAVCINNIISARAVNNLNHVGEGTFIKKTAPAVVVFCLVAILGVFACFIAWELF